MMSIVNVFDTAGNSDSASQDVSLKNDLLLSVGFGLMLAWHYLVLFSPIIDNVQKLDISQYAFTRQLTLYISLAITFGVIGIVRTAHSRHGRRFVQPPALVYAAGIVAVFSSGFSALVSYENTIPVIISITLLGASQAILMFLWLNRFLSKYRTDFLASFSIDMAIGGAIALLICMLQWPQSTVVAVALPAISSLFLAHDNRNTQTEENAEEQETTPGDEEAASEEATQPELQRASAGLSKPRYMMVSVGIYAFSFGLMQGAFLQSGMALLITDNAFVMLGIVLAGAIIYQIPKGFGHGVSVDLMHRFSLILFVAGAVLVAFFSLGEPLPTISQTAVLAGFNLFDFGVMVYGMHNDGEGGLQVVHVLEGGRPLVYASLATGLLLGYLALPLITSVSTEFALIMVCGTSIFLLASTTILPFYAIESLSASNAGANAQDSSTPVREPANVVELLANASAEANGAGMQHKDSGQEKYASPWRDSCNQIAKLYQLSPRETEIFLLVAKGRNADHIQQKLVISTHTAKTHIANIYRKLEVHSQQELLDLIEAFRDADRRLSEREDE